LLYNFYFYRIKKDN